MTTFNRTTDLPAGIVTLEQLLCWALVVGEKLYYPEEYSISNTLVAPVAQYSTSKDNNGQLRLYAIFAMPLNDDNFPLAGFSLWLKASVINTVSIPADYKA